MRSLVSTESPAGPRSRSLRILLVTVLGLAAVLFLAWTVAGYSRAWCSTCHAMRPFAARIAPSGHAGVACFRCHGSSPAAYAALRGRELGEMLPRFVASLGRAEVRGPGQRTPDDGCLRCHGDINEGTVGKHGLRIRHALCASDRSCLDCHSQTGHGKATRVPRGATMDDCVACHDGNKAAATCDTCHAAKLANDRLARGIWSVTHGRNWKQTHGLGDLRGCRACHPADYCKRCHGIELPHAADFPRTHGKTALSERQECVKCHTEKAFCTACHGVPMPHPATFLPQHSKIASGFMDPACARCHRRETCEACHAAHTHPGNTKGTLGGVALPKAVTR